MAIDEIRRQAHEEEGAEIRKEMREHLGAGFRLTDITFLDSTGEQLGWRLHDDNRQIRYLLYSYFDWKRIHSFYESFAGIGNRLGGESGRGIRAV
jgi:hypothetical protein